MYCPHEDRFVPICKHVECPVSWCPFECIGFLVDEALFVPKYTILGWCDAYVTLLTQL